MLSDRTKELNVIILTRHFVNTPQGSEFANELKKIMFHYVENTVKKKRNKQLKIIYDEQMWNMLVGTSCVC